MNKKYLLIFLCCSSAAFSFGRPLRRPYIDEQQLNQALVPYARLQALQDGLALKVDTAAALQARNQLLATMQRVQQLDNRLQQANIELGQKVNNPAFQMERNRIQQALNQTQQLAQDLVNTSNQLNQKATIASVNQATVNIERTRGVIQKITDDIDSIKKNKLEKVDFDQKIKDYITKEEEEKNREKQTLAIFKILKEQYAKIIDLNSLVRMLNDYIDLN